MSFWRQAKPIFELKGEVLVAERVTEQGEDVTKITCFQDSLVAFA